MWKFRLGREICLHRPWEAALGDGSQSSRKWGARSRVSWEPKPQEEMQPPLHVMLVADRFNCCFFPISKDWPWVRSLSLSPVLQVPLTLHVLIPSTLRLCLHLEIGLEQTYLR
uniref:Uncharacterized protein n=1 Tax=Chelydra serpentina TaxID=8475 RepID=A0A8C3SSZ5_CHESE